MLAGKDRQSIPSQKSARQTSPFHCELHRTPENIIRIRRRTLYVGLAGLSRAAEFSAHLRDDITFSADWTLLPMDAQKTSKNASYGKILPLVDTELKISSSLLAVYLSNAGRARSGSVPAKGTAVYDSFMSGAVDRWDTKNGNAPRPSSEAPDQPPASSMLARLDLRREGLDAFSLGTRRSANPHHGNSAEWSDWMDGWDHEQSRSARTPGS